MSALPVFDPHDPDLRDLAQQFEPTRFAPGEVLFAEGEPAEALFVVEEGEVELTTAGKCRPCRSRP